MSANINVYDVQNIFADLRSPGNTATISGSAYNIGIGYEIGNTVSNSDYNILIGYNAGFQVDNVRDNTIIGKYGGYNLSNATDNIFVGTGAGYNVRSGNYNVFMGKDAGRYAEGSENMFLGCQAGGNSSATSNSTFIGREAGYLSNSSNLNVFIGHRSGYLSNNNELNVFIGAQSGYYNQGVQNTFIGSDAGHHGTTGSYNSAIGFAAGKLNATGNNNIALGSRAGYSNKASNNAFLGTSAGEYHETGDRNTFIGTRAGRFAAAGDENIFIGSEAGSNAQTSRNIAMGYQAGLETSGNLNVLLGILAGAQALSNASIMIGNATGVRATLQDSVIVGHGAGDDAWGTKNVVLGDGAAHRLHGHQNVVVGQANVTTSNGSIVVGNVDASNIQSCVVFAQSGTLDSGTNVTYVGPRVRGNFLNANNAVVLGTLPEGTLVANDTVYLSTPSQVILSSNADTFNVGSKRVTIQGNVFIDGNIVVRNYDIPVNVGWANVTNVPPVIQAVNIHPLITSIVATNNPLLTVDLGGTGRSALTLHKLLVGNGANAIAQYDALTYQDSTGTLGVYGNIAVQSRTSPFETIYLNNGTVMAPSGFATIEGNVVSRTRGWEGQTIPVSKGGTGATILGTNQILLGDATNPVKSSARLAYDPTTSNVALVGNLSANTIQCDDLLITSQKLKVGSTVETQSYLIGSNVVINADRDFRGNAIQVAYGGTGLTDVPASRVLFGTGGHALATSPSIAFYTSNQALVVQGNVVSQAGGFNTGSLQAIDPQGGWTGLTLPVYKGGTGKTSWETTQVLFGNLEQSSNLRFSGSVLTVTGNVSAATVQSSGGFYTAPASQVVDANGSWVGQTLPVERGGTGRTSLASNQVLLGNAAGAVTNSIKLVFNPTSGNLAVQGNVAVTHAVSSNEITSNAIVFGTLQPKNYAAPAIDATGQWLGVTIPISKGGTGRTSFQTDQFIFGNMEQSPNVTIVQGNTLRVEGALSVTGAGGNVTIEGGTVKAVQGFSTTVPVIDAQGEWIGPTIPVARGGTGTTVLNPHQVLLGNAGGAIQSSSNLAFNPTSNVLTLGGNLQAQAATFYSDVTIFADTTLNANLTVVGNTTVVALVANTLRINAVPVLASNGAWIGPTLPVSVGGTGRTSLQKDRLLLGNLYSPIEQSDNLFFSANVLNVLGAANVSGDPGEVVTLQEGHVRASQGFYVADQIVNNTGHWVGQTIAIERGGTGTVTLASNHILIGNGTNAIRTFPTFTYDPDANTVTLIGNLRVSNVLVMNSLSAFDPNNEFADINTERLLIQGNTVIDEKGDWLGNTIPVSKGGTGVVALTDKSLLFGGLTTVKQSNNLLFNEATNLLELTDGRIEVKTSSTKAILYSDGTVKASNGYVLSDTIGTVIDDLGNWKGKIIPVAKGGTGLASLPQNRVLLGNNGSSVLSSPNFSFYGSNNVPGNLNTLSLENANVIVSNAAHVIRLEEGRRIVFENGDVGARVVLDSDKRIGTQADSIEYKANAHVWIDNDKTLFDLNKSSARLHSGNLALSGQPGDAPTITLETATGNVSGGRFLVGDTTVITPQGEYVGNVVSVNHGGTGLSSVSPGHLLLGNTATSLAASSQLRYDGLDLYVTGNVRYTGNLIGDTVLSSNVASLSINGIVTITGDRHWVGDTIAVAHGGTGSTTLDAGSVLVGNGTNIVSPSDLQWNNTYGALGVGLVPASSDYRVDVNGKVRSSEGFLLTSDRRVKTDIESITGALEKVDQVGGYTYRRINRLDTEREAGVIAQEIEAILPEAVYTDPATGTKSVSYPAIVGLLLEAVKELHAQVKTLQHS